MNPRSLFLPSLSLLLALAGTTRATPTENTGLRVLPAPGKVIVDGQVADWDLSSGVFACDDVQTQRESMAVWFHAMYDADYLYVLARFIDETPMNNPGQTIADYGFAGDSLQVRTITAPGTSQERGQHFTAWHGRDGLDVIKVEQGKDFKEGVVEDAKKTDGARQAFIKNPDGKGYVQEIAIPWKLLTRDGKPLGAGASLQLTIEPNFTVGIKGRFSIKDIFKPGLTPDRVFTFMSANCWGTATLEPKGGLPPKPVRLADAREFPVSMVQGVPSVDWKALVQSAEIAGFKPVEFDMPFDGFVSLNIKGPGGEVARQLLTCAPYPKGHHTVKWDGLTTWSWTKPGEAVAPGSYTWSAIAHTGLGLKLRGWAANSGAAPWDSDDGRGNWGGDHGVPVTVAADATLVYLGWNGAEAGKSILATDTEGRVLWTNNRAGICGVKFLAADNGVLYVLGGSAGADADGANLYKLNTKDGAYLKWEGTDSADLKIASLWSADAQAKPGKANTVSIVDGKIRLGFHKDGFTATLDAHNGKLLGTTPGSTTPAVSTKDQVHYVWKGEPENQILVMKEGKEIRRIGRKGGRALTGPWQPDGLRSDSAPAGMAVDGAGQLWVAEADGAPKRISVWDPQTGKLIREFFGSTGYGALGGAISPLDPDIMVGQGCEWRLDPKTGQAACLGVITRGGMENARFASGSNGKLYLAVADKWAFEPGAVTLYERLGDGDYQARTSFRYEGKGASAKTTLWTDANGDAQEQPGEITTAAGELRFSGWFMNLGPDLTITAGNKQLACTGFTACGAPVYDLTKPVKLPASGLSSADRTQVIQPGSYGETHTAIQCFDVSNGRKLWSYPDNFNGVHGSHNASPPALGMIRGSYGPTGSVKLPGPIGNLYVFPTNVGEWHLLTGDGFYLSRLFEGDPLKVKWPEKAVPGVDMSKCPPGMGGEDFGGSVTLAKDGKLYVQSGKTGYWNLVVTGLESVTALPGGSLTMDAKDQELARQFHDGQLQKSVGLQKLVIKTATPKFTGSLDSDFKGADIVSFKKQDDSSARAAAARDGSTLYLAWDVRDRTPWVNGAESPDSLYLGGDTVDFQLGTNAKADPQRTQAAAGDLRLSIGDFKGAPVAVLYRPVSADKAPKTFSSGTVASYVMEYVKPLEGVTIKVTKRGDGYVVEAAIPLAALGLPEGPHVLRGDFGVTYGDNAGKRTRLRNHWSNQHTGLVDDAVHELMLEPKNWGELTFQ